MKILNVGDRVEAGSYRLHSRFQRVANYTDGSRLVVLSDRSVGFGPINIVIEGDLPEADALVVEPDALCLGSRRYAFGPRYDSSLPTNPINRDMLAALAEHLRAVAHPQSLAFLLDESRISNFRDGFEQNLVRQIQAGVEKLFGHKPAQGARMLRGCGFGLTPSGDDLLAGVMIAWNCSEVGRVGPTRLPGGLSQAALPPAANPLSNAFLALAAEGRVNEAMKNVLAALGRRGREPRASSGRPRPVSRRNLRRGCLDRAGTGDAKRTLNVQQPTSNAQQMNQEAAHDGPR